MPQKTRNILWAEYLLRHSSDDERRILWNHVVGEPSKMEFNSLLRRRWVSDYKLGNLFGKWIQLPPINCGKWKIKEQLWLQVNKENFPYFPHFNANANFMGKRVWCFQQRNCKFMQQKTHLSACLHINAIPSPQVPSSVHGCLFLLSYNFTPLILHLQTTTLCRLRLHLIIKCHP